MTRLGTKFTVVLALGAVLGAGAAIAAAVGGMRVAVAALAMTAVLVFVAAAFVKADLHGTRTDLRRVAQDMRQVRMMARKFPRAADRVSREVRRDLSQSSDALRGHLSDTLGVEHARLSAMFGEEFADNRRSVTDAVTTAVAAQVNRSVGEVDALYQLFARHSPRVAIRCGDGGTTPRQTLDVLEVIRSAGSSAVLAAGLGKGALWVGYELAARAGQCTVLVPDGKAAAGLTADVAAHHLDATIRVVEAPLVPVNVAHHYLPWHDLTALPDSPPLDLAVLGPSPNGPRTFRPALPLLAGRLAPGARVAVTAPRRGDAVTVLEWWHKIHGAEVDDTLSTDDVTVVRVP